MKNKFMIKVKKSSLRTEKEIEYLKKEIKLLKQINHPNILKLVQSFEDKDNVYIIMEHASNHSVANYIQKKERLSEINSFVLFIQACLAIDHLHKIGFIHRDINVLKFVLFPYFFFFPKVPKSLD